MTNRAALRFIILATTEQDIYDCTACQTCYVDEALKAQFDMPLWQVIAAARKNDEAALSNQTIWVLDSVTPDAVCCSNGLDILAVARALRQEARRRGIHKNMVQ